MLKNPSIVVSGGIIACILCLLPLNFSAQTSSDIQSYVAQFKQIALEQEKTYGVPAPITLAQGILESGAGRSGLTRNANNHFGIKAYGGWTGRIYLAWDDEATKSKFRWYNSASESFRDHSLFLKNNSRYRSLFSKSIYDYRGWANGLQRAGYATSPTYAKALIGYIDTYKLYAINGGVKLRPGKTITITKTITKEELVGRKDLQLEETEESEEQESFEKTILKFVVEINGVRCTILYPGETLSSIAMKYDISKRDLLLFNETTSENDFQEGDIVFLGKKKKKYEGAQDFYRAKEGESLYTISQRFGIKLANLSKMNLKDSFSLLSEGEKLRLK
ncbi:MAG: glucosaminidase domain-containing protein [Prevotella sp.]|nr:glucosaminidase domain-containing protein [Prevotella sp.]